MDEETDSRSVHSVNSEWDNLSEDGQVFNHVISNHEPRTLWFKHILQTYDHVIPQIEIARSHSPRPRLHLPNDPRESCYSNVIVLTHSLKMKPVFLHFQ